MAWSGLFKESMRINLKVPFAQKDAAKELGARWDAALKVWYVIDPESLDVFSDWMPQPQTGPSTSTNTAIVKVVSAASEGRKGVLTGPAVLNSMCDCPVLPWDHCAHSR
jgi:hypothetical protein